MASLTDILYTIQNGVKAVNELATRIGIITVSLSNSATTGSLTFNSSQPAGFLTVTTSSGGKMKVAVYNQ